MTFPTRVSASISLEPVSLRRFAHPYHRALCGNCEWISYDYINKDEAEAVGDSHAERCCARINEELALTVDVVATLVQDVEHGQHILLRDLRVMDVGNIEIFDDEVMVTYSISGLESQILMLPLNHIVKVVVVTAKPPNRRLTARINP